MLRLISVKLNQLSGSYFPAPPGREVAEEHRRYLLVVCHPVIDNSFSHGIANAVEAGAIEGGHEVRRIDLYNSGFNPTMSTVERLSNRANMSGDRGRQEF